MLSPSEMPSSNFPERGFLCQQNPSLEIWTARSPQRKENSSSYFMLSPSEMLCSAFPERGFLCQPFQLLEYHTLGEEGG